MSPKKGTAVFCPKRVINKRKNAHQQQQHRHQHQQQQRNKLPSSCRRSRVGTTENLSVYDAIRNASPACLPRRAARAINSCGPRRNYRQFFFPTLFFFSSFLSRTDIPSTDHLQITSTASHELNISEGSHYGGP